LSTRAALLGTGFWARRAHVPALRELRDVELVACAGATEEEGRAFAAEHGIPAGYGSLEALLEREAPELLAVVAPDDVHPAATSAALERGIAVFCEKPLANDAATAARLGSLAARMNVPATVGYSFRFSPALQALGEDVAKGVIGEPWLIELYEHNPQFHPLRGRPMSWKGDPAHAAAGALYEYGSHAVDLARWLVGEIRAVSTNFGYVREDARLDDIATLQLRFEGRAVGLLVAAWVLSGGFPGIRVRVHGSELLGEAVLDEIVPGGEAYRRLTADGSVRETIELERLADPVSGYTQRHYAALLAWLRGEGHADYLPTLHEGARTQLVLEAALAATERWIEVPPESLLDFSARGS
jgi:predicted dehydrogenase